MNCNVAYSIMILYHEFMNSITIPTAHSAVAYCAALFDRDDGILLIDL